MQAEGDAVARAGGGALLESTFFWKQCRFTTIWSPQREAIGYEVSCRHPAHETCRRSMRFHKHGGEQMTLLCLKWWLLQASHFPDRAGHIRSCPFRPETLPSSEELEAQELVFQREDAQEAPQRKRRRRQPDAASSAA